MLPYSYIGSCRYEHVFQNAYPGRLHSIKEINYFLENLNFDNRRIKVIKPSEIQSFVEQYKETINL